MPAYTYRNSARIIEVDDPVETPAGDRGLLRKIILVMGDENTPWGEVWLRGGSTEDWPLDGLTYVPLEVDAYEELVDMSADEADLMGQVIKLKLALEAEQERYEDSLDDSRLRIRLLEMALAVTPERVDEHALDHAARFVTKAYEMLDFLSESYTRARHVDPESEENERQNAWAQLKDLAPEPEPMIVRPFSDESVVIGSSEPVVEEDDGQLAVLAWGAQGEAHFNIINRTGSPNLTVDGEPDGAS